MRIISALLLTAGLLYTGTTFAQKAKDDNAELMALLDENTPHKKDYTSATFKSTRLINGHTIENIAPGVLDFRIGHRFGELRDGLYSLFGLDGASTLLGLDYGINRWLMVGINRSTYQKEFQGFVKTKILRQTEGKGVPLSLSYFGAASAQTVSGPSLPPGQEYYFSNRMFYVNQLLIARKFNKWLSVQLMPTHIHYNLVPTTGEPNDLLAMGIGGRIKLNNRVALTSEYHYRFNQLAGYFNCFSVGVDIETGGHVFQLMFTNATAMTERAFIGQSGSDWSNGGIHFGFNISRVFTIVKPKEFQGSKW
jgi:hypothetical protein